MADVSMAELLARSAVSLAVVLALVLGAYVVLRRRGSGPTTVRRRRAGGGVLRATRVGSLRAPAGGSGRTARSHRSGLRVVGRAGVGRTASVTAVQFGERVLLIGAADQGTPTVLAELDGTAWAQWTGTVRAPAITTGELVAESDADLGRGSVALTAGVERTPRGLLDALREATTRRV